MTFNDTLRPKDAIQHNLLLVSIKHYFQNVLIEDISTSSELILLVELLDSDFENYLIWLVGNGLYFHSDLITDIVSSHDKRESILRSVVQKYIEYREI